MDHNLEIDGGDGGLKGGLDQRMVVKEIEDRLLEEMEVSHVGKEFGLWFEQDIDGESEDDNEKKLVVVNEEG
nr:hypothetical protein [Tanacetum cinerariifolium]